MPVAVLFDSDCYAGGGALDALLEYSTGSVKIQTEEVPYIVRYSVVASLGQAICVILLLDRRLSLRRFPLAELRGEILTPWQIILSIRALMVLGYGGGCWLVKLSHQYAI